MDASRSLSLRLLRLLLLPLEGGCPLAEGTADDTEEGVYLDDEEDDVIWPVVIVGGEPCPPRGSVASTPECTDKPRISLGSVKCVVRLLWSTKYGFPDGVFRCSQPGGSGP